MADDDDLQQRLDALTVSEMRRRVDLVVAFLREQRRALAVEVGMTLEDAPGPRPTIDHEQGQRHLQELVEMLPLLRRRLTPEERARIQPMSEARAEQMKEVLDELASQPELFDSLMEEGGIDVRHADIVRMREGVEKMEMLKDIEREVRLLVEELTAYRERLEESVAEMMKKAGGPSN
ncbi:hypothetical protein KEG38_04770 [Polyangium jinanense]|uniref:hypothetical protein n=1 Tax=Polyangium jinanense TaxID=2829994 RepID=UPI00234190A1|nr:hypothetical protein [Polyangium jinanense]MDC3953143.1 hypothetical protein [Polyangium jinanense]